MDFDTVHKNIVIIPDADPNTVGAFVWWTLNGELNLSNLEANWHQELSKYPLPAPPSEATALRRAVMELQKQRRLARSLPDDRSGYAIVDESPDPVTTLSYNVALQVWNEKGTLYFNPLDHPLRNTITTAYDRHLVTIGSDDVRHWLTHKVLPLALAVTLRQGGGVYFIPDRCIRDFRLILHGIKSASAHRIFAVPAQRSEDAVAGVLDAICTETEDEIEQMNKKLNEEGLGKRALNTQLGHCNQQIEKLKRYEELLGTKQNVITDRLMLLRAQFTEAMLREDT
jgi:hypothetical protein